MGMMVEKKIQIQVGKKGRILKILFGWLSFGLNLLHVKIKELNTK